MKSGVSLLMNESVYYTRVRATYTHAAIVNSNNTRAEQRCRVNMSKMLIIVSPQPSKGRNRIFWVNWFPGCPCWYLQQH